MKFSFKKNIFYRIKSLSGDSDTVERLCELGFHRGVFFKILAKAPFSAPFIVKTQDTTVALREKELLCIQTVAL